MIKRSLLLLLPAFFILLTPTLAASQADQPDEQGYHIKFQIKGAQDTIQLAYYYGDKKLLKEKVPADANGKFEFKGDTPLECGIYLVVIPDKGYFEFVANGSQHFTMKSDTSNLIQNMKVTGNEENMLFYDYLRFINPKGREIGPKAEKFRNMEDTSTVEGRKLRKEIATLEQEIIDYKKNFRETHKGTFVSALFTAMEEVPTPLMEDIQDEEQRKRARFNYYKAHFFDNMPLDNDCMVRTPILAGKIEKYLRELTVQAPDSVIKELDYLIAKAGDSYEMYKYLVTTETRNSEKSKIMCFDKVKMHMYKKYYLDDPRTDWIDEEIRKKIDREYQFLRFNQCGDKAQELRMYDTLGVEHRLGQVDAEYTVAYFWSATCGHCKKATPKLQELYDRIKDQYDVEVFSVNIDRDLKHYKDFINKYQFDWINVFDTADVNYFRQKYNVQSTPQIYILDYEKRIVAKKIDVDTIEKIIQEHKEKVARKEEDE